MLKKVKVFQKDKDDDGLIRLNKFIANAGICSRREDNSFSVAKELTENKVKHKINLLNPYPIY